MNYEIGKTYEISHSRKGKMTVAITALNDEWVECLIVDGYAKSVNGGAVAVEGEPLTFRASLATIIREIEAA